MYKKFFILLLQAQWNIKSHGSHPERKSLLQATVKDCDNTKFTATVSLQNFGLDKYHL